MHRSRNSIDPPEVRLATVADSRLFAMIHAKAFSKADAWSNEVFSLQLGLHNVIGLACREQGIILVRFAAEEAEVLTIAVMPSGQRRGIASSLLRQALIHLVAAGANVVFLEVSVKNTAGLALYTGFGFTSAGRRRRYYSDGSDALVLRLDLGPELAAAH